MNYIVALTVMRKVLQLQILSNWYHEKFSYEKFSPSRALSHTITKQPKTFFATQKSLRILKVFIDKVVFRFQSNRAFFRFLFRVLSKRVFFESSVIGFSSGSLVIGSSLRSSVGSLFPPCHYFLSNRTNTFLSKTKSLFNIFSKRSSHLTISLTFLNKFKSETHLPKKLFYLLQ